MGAGGGYEGSVVFPPPPSDDGGATTTGGLGGVITTTGGVTTIGVTGVLGIVGENSSGIRRGLTLAMRSSGEGGVSSSTTSNLPFLHYRAKGEALPTNE